MTLAVGGLACGDDAQGTPDWFFPKVIPLVPEGTSPQYRGDPTHVGLAAPGTRLQGNLTLAWKTAPLGIGNYPASKSSPAVDVDRVYVGVDDGQLIALDRRDGTIRWRFQTHRYLVELGTADSFHLGIHGSPAFDDRNVYIGDYSGFLYAVDKATGSLVWENQLGGSIGASPVLLGDFVFIAVEFPAPDGKVFVLRAHSGELVWATPSLGHFPHASVSIDAARGLLFVGANNGFLYCFDYGRRQEVWAYRTGAAIKSTAAVFGDSVYVTSWDTKMRGILVASGEARLEFATTAASMSSPTVFENRAYFGSDDGRLYAVDIRNGHLDWSFQTHGPILSSPTAIQDSALIAVGSQDGHVYLLDVARGKLRQALQLGSAVSSVPVAAGNSLFVNDDAGTVYAFFGARNAGD